MYMGKGCTYNREKNYFTYFNAIVLRKRIPNMPADC